MAKVSCGTTVYLVFLSSKHALEVSMRNSHMHAVICCASSLKTNFRSSTYTLALRNSIVLWKPPFDSMHAWFNLSNWRIFY